MVSRAVIVYLTKHKGLQGAQIAEQLGVTKSFVSAVLTGKKMLAIEHADRLDRLFGGRFNALAALRLERALKKQLTLISGAERQMMEAWQSLQR
jgi:plasmid maintenance system antidote protein VapI